MSRVHHREANLDRAKQFASSLILMQYIILTYCFLYVFFVDSVRMFVRAVVQLFKVLSSHITLTHEIQLLFSLGVYFLLKCLSFWRMTEHQIIKLIISFVFWRTYTYAYSARFDQNKKEEKVFSIVKCRMSQTEKRNKRWIKSKFLFWTKLKRSHWIWYLPFILIIVDILFVALRCLCNALSHFLSFPPLFLDGIRFDKYARLRRTVSVNCLFRMVVVFFYLSLWTLDRQCVVPVHVLCISSVYFS